MQVARGMGGDNETIVLTRDIQPSAPEGFQQRLV